MTTKQEHSRPREPRGGRDNHDSSAEPRAERNLVLPGDAVGDKRSIAGPGTKKVGDKVVAVTAGLLQTMGEKVSVLAMNGSYDPKPGDLVVGVINEANTGNWIVDIRAPWMCPLHVSEVPWRVDFGETTSYLKPGDAILCKVLFVDEQKKVQVTLKDRNLMKLEGGELMEVPPVKVARVIGKSGSMLNMLKEYVECWMLVGQNGRIWLNGNADEVLLAKEAIQSIVDHAHLPGVTERVKALLESRRPGGIDAGLPITKADSTDSGRLAGSDAESGESTGKSGKSHSEE
ncbi:MAG: exosome complex RNA-binding protein Rrp4 [Candidatus Thermoplasmatota archaeon]|jgi:exosome complex component RRP4